MKFPFFKKDSGSNELLTDNPFSPKKSKNEIWVLALETLLEEDRKREKEKLEKPSGILKELDDLNDLLSVEPPPLPSETLDTPPPIPEECIQKSKPDTKSSLLSEIDLLDR